MTSIIKVDTLQTAAGGVPTASDLGIGVAGTVLQVLQGPYQNRVNFNLSLTTGSTIYSAPTITPTSANSKILIMAQHSTEKATDNGSYVYTSIYEGNTQLAANGYSGSLANAHGYQVSRWSRQSAAGSFLYDVTSTSALNFHIKCSGGSDVNTSNWYFYGCAITLMEIAG
jgi:hypothetical protein